MARLERVYRGDGAGKEEAVPRWRARRDAGGAAALARRAAAAGDVSLLRALEPVVDLVTAVDRVTNQHDHAAPGDQDGRRQEPGRR